MVKYVNECVGCEHCAGAGCSCKNVERHICEDCGGEATCILECDELCNDCLNKSLDSLWSELTSEEKAEMLGVTLERLDD